MPAETIINNFTINSTEANAIQNEISRKIEQLDEPEDHIHRRKIMYWYQAKFDPDSETGNRAIIEVETVRGVPKMYKVLRYYPEYTFDPEEE